MANFYQPPEPRQAYPKVLPQTQGAAPKPAAPLGGSVNALTAMGVWATLAAVPMPVQKPLNVVPLTLRYGSQPAPQAPLTVTETNMAVRSWDLPQQQPPALIGVAAIKGIPAAPVYIPFNPTNPAIGLWPQQDWRAQSEPDIAPLTLPRGDSVPFAPQQLGVITVSWPAQSAPPSAAWNVPAVVQSIVLRGVNQPRWIYDYWTSPSDDIQYSGAFLPQNPSDPPPVQGPITVADLSILRLTWEPLRREPPRPVQVSTLTLARGDQVPFFRPPIIWPALDWPYQSEENNAGWNFVPPVVSQPIPYVRFQSHLLAPAIYWPAQSEADNGAWNVPAIVNNPPPYTRLRIYQLLPGPGWGAQSYPPNAAWNFISLSLARAIAQSDASDALTSGSSSIVTLIQNSGTVSIISVDSKTIQLIIGSSGVSSIDPNE